MTMAASRPCRRWTAIALAAWASAALPRGAARAAEPGSEAPRITTQAFGGWTYRCQQPMTDGKPGAATCVLDQPVIVNQNGAAVPVMTVIFTHGAKARGYGLSIKVPLGVRLRPGIGVSADSGAVQLFSFDYCGPRACWADGALGEPLLRELKHGRTGRAKLVFFNGQTAVVEFPLAGLPAGLAALDGAGAPAP